MTGWLRRLDCRSAPNAHLFCFPHAGGTAASFRLWPGGLPPTLAVWGIQLPGRPGRLQDAPIDSIPALVAALTDALLPHLGQPFAMFGHSMGAVLAFETAAALGRMGAPLPQHLILSSRRPPHRQGTEPDMHRLDDAAFVAEIDRRYGGIPAELLHDRDVMALLLPGLRADITALETHRPTHCAPLDVPITACGGTEDRRTTRADIAAWAELTTGPFRMRMFAGGHFYLEPQRAVVLDHLSAALAPMLRPAARDPAAPGTAHAVGGLA
jgi:surfactin synthase thioesterase subunit